MNKGYFNNAGAGLMSKSTLDTVIGHMEYEMKVGAYKAATDRNEDVTNFYIRAMKLLNAKSKNEIAFIDSASRGWNLVMYGMKIKSTDCIVTLESEYGTNLLTIYDIAQKTGCSVKIVKCDKEGNVNPKEVEIALKDGGTILAVSHVAAQGAIVNPVLEFGKIAQQYGALYIVDGCQAVGQMKVDVQDIKCDAYITAGRKWLRGPRGTGILYVKEGTQIRTPQIDLASADIVFDEDQRVSGIKVREDAKQFELWEKSIANLLGLSNAIKEYIDFGERKVAELVMSKTEYIRECICSNNKLTFVGSRHAPTGISGFYVKNLFNEDNVKSCFEREGFKISCICDWDCPLFFPSEGVKYIFRISPHFYTEEEDVQAIGQLIRQL